MGKKVKLKRVKPIVQFAGSMVQQNHGELLEKHGYLLWDLTTKTYEEFDIHNDFGYVTVDIIKGRIPSWIHEEKETKLPKHPRLRLRFNKTEPSDIKKCITEFKKLFSVSEVTVTRTDTIGQLKTNLESKHNIVGNVRDDSFQDSLIREYLERQFLLSYDDLDAISDINKELNSQLSSEELSENITWVPKSFEFSNMFSYGEDNKIDFGNSRDIIGIFAPNASGKSSIFDALSFCLFDKTSRTYLSKNVLNNRKTDFKCKFHFTINGEDYFIERRGKLVSKGTSVKVDVDFWKEVDGEVESLNGEQRRETNHIIQKYLGTYDDFSLTTLSIQGNDSLFIDKSQSERKEILSQFLGLNIFDKLHQKAVEENRENTALIKKFKRDDFTSQLAEIETQLNDLSKDYSELQDSQEKFKKEEERLQSEINDLNKKIVQLDVSNFSIDTLKSELSTLEQKSELIQQESGSKVEMKDSRLDLKKTTESLIEQYDVDSLEESVNSLIELGQKSKEFGSEIEKKNISLDSLYEQKSHLDSHEYNEECDVCIKNSKTIIEQKGINSTRIENLVSSIDELTERKKLIDENIESLDDIKQTYSKYRELKDKNEAYDKEVSELITKLSSIETSVVRVHNEIEKKKTLIESYYKNEKQIEENESINKEIQSIDSELRGVKKSINDTNSSILDLNGKISTLNSKKESIENQIQEIKKLEKQQKRYEYYLSAVSRDGVSYDLISKTLPMIEGEINNVLSQIVEFGMQLEMDGKNINAYIVYDDQKWALEMCSGMERFISGLAIRIALINISNIPRPNFLVIDEGFGTLDSENLTSLYMLFSYLKTQFDFVMIISHIDSMRDVVDNLLEVKKEDGFSKVTF